MDANTVFEDGSTPLHIAAGNGAIQMMMLLMRHDADVNIRDSKGRTPLMVAIGEGVVESVSLLIKKDADVMLADNDGVIPVTRAAESGSKGLVAMLLDEGVPVDSRDADGRTPLMAAAIKGQALLVGSLVGTGATCTAVDNKGNTPMHYAASGMGNEVTLQFLGEKADLVNKPNNDGETPLITAIESHNMDNVAALMELGANPLQADKDGVNAMGHASALRRVKFRQAMTEILQHQGEAVRRLARKGTGHEVKTMKPLVLKKPSNS
jgi:ankyrin repeat protein